MAPTHTQKEIDSKLKTEFRRRLLGWYQKNKRDLPWRRTKDPYAIWVSEIMLQQTQVGTVIPYYEKFLTKFPTVKKLSKASEEDVLSLWSGLGYYRRAKHLHWGAKKVQEEWKGELPKSPEELVQIPGIGEYTAGAIASIAFDQHAPLVDGNVIRVLSRVFAQKGHAKESKLQKRIWSLAGQLVKGKKAGDFNQALMELGATLCRTAIPSCESCPLNSLCVAHQKGAPEDFPESPPTRKPLKLNRVVAVCQRGEEILLVRRKNPRWFKGLWELPHEYFDLSQESSEVIRSFLNRTLGIRFNSLQKIPATQHQITHHKINSYGWLAQTQGPSRFKNHYEIIRFFTPHELTNAPLPNLDKKVLRAGGILASGRKNRMQSNLR